ncbi:transcription factor jumonji jmjc domain-containing protein [Sphingomonas elodea]|uniref:transcription factor jumonji jmjc domain-containing protein n=1 Tax=Sphingomonas elodea TaxID=179878 RepID=UPI000263091A
MNALAGTAPAVRVVEGVAPDAIPFGQLLAGQVPVILKGVAAHWPLVQAGQHSADAAMDLL